MRCILTSGARLDDVDYFANGVNLDGDTFTTRTSKLEIAEVKGDSDGMENPSTKTVGVFYDSTNLTEQSKVEEFGV